MCALAALLLATAVTTAPPVVRAADPKPIALAIERERFDPAEIKVKAGEPFVLAITNRSAKAAEFESKDLRVEKVVPAGKTVNVKVRALTPGTYQFMDDFNKQTTGRILAE
jgi:plastocyanin